MSTAEILAPVPMDEPMYLQFFSGGAGIWCELVMRCMADVPAEQLFAALKRRNAANEIPFPPGWSPEWKLYLGSDFDLTDDQRTLVTLWYRAMHVRWSTGVPYDYESAVFTTARLFNGWARCVSMDFVKHEVRVVADPKECERLICAFHLRNQEEAADGKAVPH